MVKNLAASAGDVRDVASISGSRRSSEGVYGNPLPGLPGESHRQRGLVGYSPEDHKQ